MDDDLEDFEVPANPFLSNLNNNPTVLKNNNKNNKPV